MQFFFFFLLLNLPNFLTLPTFRLRPILKGPGPTKNHLSVLSAVGKDICSFVGFLRTKLIFLHVHLSEMKIRGHWPTEGRTCSAHKARCGESCWKRARKISRCPFPGLCLRLPWQLELAEKCRPESLRARSERGLAPLEPGLDWRSRAAKREHQPAPTPTASTHLQELPNWAVSSCEICNRLIRLPPR